MHRAAGDARLIGVLEPRRVFGPRGPRLLLVSCNVRRRGRTMTDARPTDAIEVCWQGLLSDPVALSIRLEAEFRVLNVEGRRSDSSASDHRACGKALRHAGCSARTLRTGSG